MRYTNNTLLVEVPKTLGLQARPMEMLEYRGILDHEKSVEVMGLSALCCGSLAPFLLLGAGILPKRYN